MCKVLHVLGVDRPYPRTWWSGFADQGDIGMRTDWRPRNEDYAVFRSFRWSEKFATGAGLCYNILVS